MRFAHYEVRRSSASHCVVRIYSHDIFLTSTSATLLRFMLTVVAGWLLRQKATVMEYLNVKHHLLREQLRGVTLLAGKARHRLRRWWLLEGLMPHILAVTLTFLALMAGTPFAGDVRTMEFVEHYKGHLITVTTAHASDGGWTASARIVMSGDKTVTVEPDPADTGGNSFRSEEDAKLAALKAAVTAIDRSRVSIGKP